MVFQLILLSVSITTFVNAVSLAKPSSLHVKHTVGILAFCTLSANFVVGVNYHTTNGLFVVFVCVCRWKINGKIMLLN